MGLVAVVATLDYVTGYEVRLAILYMLPIALATWTGGIQSGILVSLASVTCWSISFHPNHIYSREIYYYWEASVLVVTFIVFILLLDRLRNALELSDKRTLHVMEGLSAGIYVVDESSGRVLYANSRFAEMVGTASASLNASEFEKNLHIVTSTSREHEIAGETTVFQYHQARDERSGQWYLVQSGPIHWENDMHVQLNVLTDITDHKQAAVLRRQHQEMLHNTARFSVLAEIASMLGHEINQPLMAIATYNAASVMLLKKPDPDIPEVIVALEKSRAQSVRASQIVEKTRGFLRRRAPSLDAGQINDVVRDAIDSLELELQDDTISVELRLADPLPEAIFDRTLIEQVVANLMRNAIDALRELQPGERGRIMVRTERAADGALHVSVSDNGMGIAPGIAEHLYAPFCTSKPHGLGLGLCICRSVIEAHAGRLWHETGANAGTTFHFTLPVQDISLK